VGNFPIPQQLRQAQIDDSRAHLSLRLAQAAFDFGFSVGLLFYVAGNRAWSSRHKC
jgi:hypothetical protein